ncbi:MAG: protease modulator HflC [Candidatus Desulfofervidaceae bacterium]|nr:protease modulator HflC [Candidatus Desulfofervidaceae bacterium]MDL1970835.1 protease modulator HflC [Candidatus Desulfofervidaceae bacterium]
MKKTPFIVAFIVILFIVTSQCFFVVDQTEQAFLLQLGKPIGGVLGPGLHFKLPFVQQVMIFERRILEYDAAPAEILTKDKKNLVVDNYSKWQIVNPLEFYKTVKTIAGAQSRLDDIIYAQLRIELGVHTLTEVVSEKRAELMEKVTKKCNELASEYGIKVVDVRIKRADLPLENERHVFERMRAEREREAKRYRSEGKEQGMKIKAVADKEKAIILAQAYKEAEKIKGEGEMAAIKIYAEAIKKDPEFYAFVKSLEVYKKGFDEKTKLVITPEEKLLRFFFLKDKTIKSDK